jgi:adenylate cyclase
MSKRSESSTDFFRKRNIVPLALFVLCGALSFTAYLAGADRALYDFCLRMKSEIAPLRISPRVLSVDLTDAVELNIGESIDSRQAFLDALRVMKVADVGGGFDFYFPTSKDRAIDAQIADAAADVPGGVFVVVPLSKVQTNFSGKQLDASEAAIVRKHLWHPRVVHKGSVPVADRFLLPYGSLAAKAVYLAHAGLISDPDGIYRRTPLLYQWEDGYMPALPLVMAVDALGIDTGNVVLDAGNRLTLPLKDGRKIDIPIDNDGCAYIPYAGLWSNGLLRIPLDKFAAAARDQASFDEIFDLIDGNILSLCDLTTSKKDFGTTPLETVYPLSGVHNSILNGLLTNTFFRTLSLTEKILILLFLAAGTVFAVTRKRDMAFNISFAVLFLSLTGLTAGLWFSFLIVPWYAGPLAALFVAWVAAWIFRLIDAYRERLLLANALSRYFPRSLAERVLKEGKTDLVPVEKELAFLFADISGFTKWSSDKTPESVHAFLSDYLESMAAILFKHGGTVDKFMGDGILAFFGDPFDQPDHTERCVAAAIEMQEKIRELAKKWRPIVGIDLKVRIGINSGKAIVGNLGSKTRIEYTVIGAAVNLAQRMESNAPVGGILVAENAWADVNTAFAFGAPQPVSAKGYEKPVNAYVVIKDFE